MDRADYMSEALALAREAMACGEVPVGAIVVDSEGNIVGRGRNRREETGDATRHAEIEAVEQACRALGDWRLEGCTLYVTLEPCPMCTGAVINARIPKLVYGLKDGNSGCCGSVINLFEERLGHKPAVYGGVLADESAELLKEFFKNART